MSSGEKGGIGRRPLLFAGAAVAGIVVAGGAIFGADRLLAGRNTAFSDIVGQIGDPGDAATVGHAVLSDRPKFHARREATRLRARIKEAGGLRPVLKSEIADGKMAEVGGWVLPESLASVCALAAS